MAITKIKFLHVLSDTRISFSSVLLVACISLPLNTFWIQTFFFVWKYTIVSSCFGIPVKLIEKWLQNKTFLVDGDWSVWSSWSACDVTCDVGRMSRMRTCSNPAPSSGGQDCVGSSTETAQCQQISCPCILFWGIYFYYKYDQYIFINCMWNVFALTLVEGMLISQVKQIIRMNPLSRMMWVNVEPVVFSLISPFK